MTPLFKRCVEIVMVVVGMVLAYAVLMYGARLLDGFIKSVSS